MTRYQFIFPVGELSIETHPDNICVHMSKAQMRKLIDNLENIIRKSDEELPGFWLFGELNEMYPTQDIIS